MRRERKIRVMMNEMVYVRVVMDSQAHVWYLNALLIPRLVRWFQGIRWQLLGKKLLHHNIRVAVVEEHSQLMFLLLGFSLGFRDGFNTLHKIILASDGDLSDGHRNVRCFLFFFNLLLIIRVFIFSIISFSDIGIGPNVAVETCSNPRQYLQQFVRVRGKKLLSSATFEIRFPGIPNGSI